MKTHYLITSLCLLFSLPACADTPVYPIAIINHLFVPDTLVIPARQKVKLLIQNRDQSTEEFESYELNREKIILGQQQGVVFIGPLEPGVYPFFGEFHPQTALGKIIAQ